MRTRYPAKILLFGEHLLLTGASALTLPLPSFFGTWQQGAAPADDEARLQRLLDFARYLQEQGLIDNTFHANLETGLFFQSNIPDGYGMGSSGALCAGIYDRYVVEKETAPQALKAVFAQMENFFHGNSSGIDPLTSYLERPLLIRQKTEVHLPDLRPWRDAPRVFVTDTRLPRQTGSLVRWFLQQWATPDFRDLVERAWLPAHETLTDAWLRADAEAFWPALRQVSAFQLRHLPPMIPDGLRPLWEKGLAEGHYLLKLCGAGGGGYMLGFAPAGGPLPPSAQEIVF